MPATSTARPQPRPPVVSQVKRAAARAVGGQVELTIELHEGVSFAFRMSPTASMKPVGEVTNTIEAMFRNPGLHV